MPISSINPATNEVLETFDALDERQLDEKISRAAEAFRRHRLTSFGDRSAKMQRAADILEAEKKKLARLMTLEMGKPINAAVGEAEKCAWVCRYYAEKAEQHLADQPVKTFAPAATLPFT